MEPNLDRVIAAAAGGDLFPQFSGDWSEVFPWAVNEAESMLSSVPQGCRIALNIGSTQAFTAAFIALCQSPVDLFLFNPSWGRTEVQSALESSKPHFVVVDIGKERFAVQRNSAEPLPMAEEGAADSGFRVMIPTGGTSGRLRFAVHDWDTLSAAVRGFQRFIGLERLSAHCLLPLYHVSGFMQLVRSMLSGGSIVFGSAKRFADSHEAIESQPVEERFVSLVATQLRRLVFDDSALPLLREYRAVLVGGGPVSPALLERCRGYNLPLAPTYGMTETAGQVSTLLPEAFLRGDHSQGRVLPHACIEIVDGEDRSSRLEKGAAGRIRVSAESLCRGYWGEGPLQCEGGWLTSDLGRFDDEENLVVLGRADNVIVSGGEKIDLREVEVCVERTQLASDAVAFAVPDAEWGERLALAYVPAEEGVSEEAIKAALRKELVEYKFPKVWIRKEALPRNAAGKIRIEALKVEAAESVSKERESSNGQR